MPLFVQGIFAVLRSAMVSTMSRCMAAVLAVLCVAVGVNSQSVFFFARAFCSFSLFSIFQ